ncbi:16790_t:CDS:2 [Cetraspora pellucida]|uniref:16790_t:CDS:1 n=1 Tax=Cetraspora pellucida TaxID=1433469 RepID=A0A9N9CKP5_9GLOM|nr:16790_t:CDS:2 [Cetraspora pellucida]
MEEVCEVVRSQKGCDKIDVHGHLMVKNLHYLQDLVQHNHLPDATHPEVIKAVTELKKRASETRKKPVQLIQNYKKIPQTQNVLEINIPPSLHVTLNDDPFLIQDLIVDQTPKWIITDFERAAINASREYGTTGARVIPNNNPKSWKFNHSSYPSDHITII